MLLGRADEKGPGGKLGVWSGGSCSCPAKEAGAVIRVDGDVEGEAAAGINACPIQGGNRI